MAIITWGSMRRRSAPFSRTAIPEGAAAIRSLVPAPVALAEIEQAHNEEYRRWLIERYGGMAPYLAAAGAETVHQDDTGRLVRRATAGEPIVAVHVTCPSTGREYMLRVPPATKTAREGVAWTFGLSADGYQPTSQS